MHIELGAIFGQLAVVVVFPLHVVPMLMSYIAVPSTPHPSHLPGVVIGKGTIKDTGLAVWFGGEWD